jgi:flagellar hook-associated protein 2
MTDSLSQISGLSSGIDFKSLVDQIITLDRRPAVAWQATIDANAKKKDAYEQFRQAVAGLKTASDALKTGSGFETFSTTASGADAKGRSVLSAAAVSGASPGSYSINVTQLAQAQKTIASVGQTSTTTALGLSGKLNVGSASITVDPTDTLIGIRDKINAVSGTTNVQATVLSGSATDNRLVLTGTKPGAANAFTITDDPSNTSPIASALGLDGAPQTQALDAQFQIDGTVNFSRPTNSVSDALPGVTLTLSALGTSNVTIDRMKSAASSAIQSFVDAYNKVVTLQKQLTDGTSAVLPHDTLVRGARSNLAQSILAPATGNPLDMQTLSAIGVSLAKDGTLTLDAAKAQDAYATRPDDVKALLADRMGAIGSLSDGLTQFGIGQIDAREQGMQAQNDALQSHIDDLASRLDKKRSAMLAQYAQFEATLGKLKSIGDSMSAQFAGLNKSNNNS